MKTKRFFTFHLLKIISVLFALLLWIFVVASETVTIDQRVKLRYLPPMGKAIGNMPPTEIVVTLRGARAFLRTALPEILDVDLNKIKYKDVDMLSLSIDRTLLQISQRLDILNVNPSSILLTFEKEISKYAQIKPNFQGALTSGNRLVSSDIKPATILIKGPLETMRQIGTIKTSPINLSDLKGSDTMEVSLSGLDARIVVDEGQKIEFSYDVKPDSANLSLKKVKIRYLASRRKFRADVFYADLSVIVPKMWKKLKADDLQIIADLPEKNTGRVKVKLKAELPDGVYLLKIEPEYINVVMEK